MTGRMVLACLLATIGTGLAQTSINTTGVQSLPKMSDAQLTSFLEMLDATAQLSAQAVPKFGNFYSLQHPEWPPLPSNPGLSAWQMDGSDSYLLNDVNYSYGSKSGSTLLVTSQNSPLDPNDFGTNDSSGGSDYSAPPDISNYAKYAAQSFSVIDTNDAAVNDTNLYSACATFTDTNTDPLLQIVQYQPGCLLLKASHFDYSAETRNFAIVVCDKVETPIFKTLDLQNPSNNISNGGWLLQGSVAPGEVTDPMFLMISNISTAYNAFFRAIPYSGPQINVTGYNSYDVVSNTIALQVDVTDLSGVTNVNFSMDASGVPVRSSITGPNTVSIDTRYNLDSYENLDFYAMTKSSVWNSDDTPVDNPQLSFTSLNTLPLDFENPIFLAYQSDEASTDIGQNDIDFYATVQVNYSATITDLDSGRLLASYSGTADPGYIPLYWNFTEADGATPWTNEQYVVNFTASPTTSGFAANYAGGATPNNDGGGGSATITVTNKIDTGVRKGAGCIITYQEEDPGDTTGSYWNSKALNWAQTLEQLYVAIYSWVSLTEYTTGDCGDNRNHGIYFSLGSIYSHWTDFLPPILTNANYSDFDIIGAHCNGEYIGFTHAYYPDRFSSTDLFGWLGDKHKGSNWRMRRATVWGCWSDDMPGTYSGHLTFSKAVGIRPVAEQMNTYCTKNAGLFFGGRAPQIFVSSGNTITSAQASTMLDEAFTCGKYPWPGSCDPTYSFRWALAALEGEYPEMMFEPKQSDGSASTTPSNPLGEGCPKLIFTTTYDDEITRLNFSHVKEN